MLSELISPETARIFGILKVVSLPVALLLAERVRVEIKAEERSLKALGAPFLIGLLAVLIPGELPLFVMVSEIAIPFYYIANPQKLLGHFELSLKGLILLSCFSEAASYLFALATKSHIFLLSLSLGFYFFSRFLNAALCSEILRSKGYGNIGAVIPSFFSIPGLLAVLLLKSRKRKSPGPFLE